MRRIHTSFLIVASFFIFSLSGCSEVQFVSEAYKKIRYNSGIREQKLNEDWVKRHGRYKIGNPYVIKGKKYFPKIDYKYNKVGIASWYGKAFHGKLTANGAIFDMNQASAAHKTLPLPSWVEVTNLKNGRQLKVLVNDRGPYVDDRIIDLSRHTAELLGFKNQGIARVRVRVLAKESVKLAKLASKVNGQKFSQEMHQLKAKNSTNQKVQNQRNKIAYDNVRKLPQKGKNDTALKVQPISTQKINAQVLPELSQAPSSALATNLARVDNLHASNLANNGNKNNYNNDDVHSSNLKLKQEHFVQAGAFSDKNNAKKAGELLRQHNIAPVIITIANVNSKQVWRVRLGPLSDTDLDHILDNVKHIGFSNARIVK